jgi:hypothetical protein
MRHTHTHIVKNIQNKDQTESEEEKNCFKTGEKVSHPVKMKTNTRG